MFTPTLQHLWNTALGFGDNIIEIFVWVPTRLDMAYYGIELFIAKTHEWKLIVAENKAFHASSEILNLS